MNGQSTNTGLKGGVSSQEKITGSEKSLGMDTMGPSQVPMATPHETVKKGGKNFTIR